MVGLLVGFELIGGAFQLLIYAFEQLIGNL